MESFITPSNITFLVGMIALLFSVYHFFRNPQIKAEKEDALLAQKVKWEKELVDDKFKEMGSRISDVMTMAQNHIHTVDIKVDSLTKTVNSLNLQLTNEIVKLGTIIEERIPKN